MFSSRLACSLKAFHQNIFGPQGCFPYRNAFLRIDIAGCVLLRFTPSDQSNKLNRPSRLKAGL